MSRHFDGFRHILSPGSRIHSIAGKSTFDGAFVPTARVDAAMMRQYGFNGVEVRAIRTRNSKKELMEFEVFAT